MKESLHKTIQKLRIDPDKYQTDLLNELELHRKNLENSRRMSVIIASTFKLFNRKKTGIYIWGGVGRGKSIIANTFYKNTSVASKRHFHFHQFMIDVHKTMWNIRERNKNLQSRRLMRHTVKTLLPHCNLLFLDELQINNIADLSILSSLFTTLKNFNIFTIITSNRKPSDLFLDSFNREMRSSLIKNIETNFQIFHLDGHLDYRSIKGAGLEKTFFHPLDIDTDKAIDSILNEITDPLKLSEKYISTEDRKVKIAQCCGNTAVFTFKELCDANLSASDYIAIAHEFKNIIIKNIPKMLNEDHNQALRFITLIDCLYENKSRLICSAETEIENLYNGKQHKFEFARTVSRLKEMSQEDYLFQKPEHILGLD